MIAEVAIVCVAVVALGALASFTRLALARLERVDRSQDFELEREADRQRFQAQLEEIRQEVRDVRSGIALTRGRG